MAWRQAFENFLRSPTMISMAGGGLVTGGYVVYKDYNRYHRMMDVYSTGNILPPLAENNYEITYFPRSYEENYLRKKFSNEFTNMYFLVNGEVGTGKTRMIIELVRDMMKNSGSKKKGAPVYVLATQGKSFPESLANAVKFNFDEHISYKFFLDYVMRIHSFPQKDDDSRLTRVLDAIEKSSFMYMQENGRPVVLIIDGANSLPAHMPGALEKIQDKAKLWADTNTVKVIFVNNDEETEELLQKNSSSWSRAASPVVMPDMSREDAIKFLMMPNFMESPIEGGKANAMTLERAENVFNLVGGRIVHLIAFKRDFVLDIRFGVTAEHLKDREREKFISVSRTPAVWVVVSALRNAPGKCLKLSKIIKSSSEKDVGILARHNIIRYDRDRVGVLVKFQSPLTERVVDELQRAYETEKGGSSSVKESNDSRLCVSEALL